MDTNLINELGTSEVAQTPEMNNEVQETDVRFASLSPAVGYGIYRVSQMPEVREAVQLPGLRRSSRMALKIFLWVPTKM